jgi:hypothetical protein
LINRNKNTRLSTTNILLTIPIIWIISSATIWRGSEYSWNGEIFYVPCRTEIPIQNNGSNKKKILKMCTMEYYSHFTGIWNGKEIEIANGTIKVPEKLKPSLDYPITKILIQPAHYNQWKDGTETKIYRYNLDSLKKNGEYKLSGEIVKIIDRKPMIQARLE